jgi:hypothetical protein
VRILLDESVPVQVRKALSSHEVSAAVEMGWRGISNGDLLDRAEAEGFQLLIVADKQGFWAKITVSAIGRLSRRKSETRPIGN